MSKSKELRELTLLEHQHLRPEVGHGEHAGRQNCVHGNGEAGVDQGQVLSGGMMGRRYGDPGAYTGCRDGSDSSVLAARHPFPVHAVLQLPAVGARVLLPAQRLLQQRVSVLPRHGCGAFSFSSLGGSQRALFQHAEGVVPRCRGAETERGE